jgi:glutathione S-transferase
MRTLYHYPLSPSSRRVRVTLAEKGLEYEPVLEQPWRRREEFLALNPAGDVPVLVEDDGFVVVGHTICEYLEDLYPKPVLLPGPVQARAEVRRLVEWFDIKFDREVTENLVGEKVIKRVSNLGQPSGLAIRAGLANIHYHLDYIAFLADRRTWLGGDGFSQADIAAGCQLSAVDYCGLVPWDEHPEAKDWYARIKSRPSFRSLLVDFVPGVPPPPHYADLDF